MTGIERLSRLDRENEELRDMLNEVAWGLGLGDSAHYYSDDNYQACQEAVLAAIDKRLMPDGMEWLVEAWPRFEDDAPARFGEEAIGFACKPPFVIDHVTLFDGGEATVCAEADLDSGKVENFFRVHPGERVKRPAPKVLDADGVEIRVGDEVWLSDKGLDLDLAIDGEPLRVREVGLSGSVGVLDQRDLADGSEDAWWLDPVNLTHRAPFLDADGVEIRVGDTVWFNYDLNINKKYTVTKIENNCPLPIICIDEDGAESVFYSSGLSHRAPVIAADGLPLREGETVWDTKGNGPYVIRKIEPDGVIRIDGNDLDYFGADFTHERPDSWERLEEDADALAEAEINGEGSFNAANDYCTRHGLKDGTVWVFVAQDLVRRAKKLAGRDR